jgi:hypothetical protein
LCHLKASVVLLSYIFVVLMSKHMHWKIFTELFVGVSWQE